MGVYVEPKTCSLATWLQSFATEVSTLPKVLDDVIADDEWLLIWIDNGLFQATAVAYSQMELERFLWSLDHGDERPFKFYIAMDSDVKEAVKSTDYGFIKDMRMAVDEN